MREIDVVIVLGSIFVDYGVAFVIIALADQPTENMIWISRIGNA